MAGNAWPSSPAPQSVIVVTDGAQRPDRRKRTVKRLTTAPNLAVATLGADLLCHAGVEVTVQRAYASSIAGELPPDQALPEIWVTDAERWEQATRLLDALRHPLRRHWACPNCHEIIDGPFEQCWNCGAEMP